MGIVVRLIASLSEPKIMVVLLVVLLQAQEAELATLPEQLDLVCSHTLSSGLSMIGRYDGDSYSGVSNVKSTQRCFIYHFLQLLEHFIALLIC